MKLKSMLLVTIFSTALLGTIPLMASDTVAPAPFDGAVARQQEALREWTSEEKETIFQEVQATLSQYNVVLNKDNVVNQGTLDLSDKLRNFRPDIHNKILTEICKFSWLTELDLYKNKLTTLPPEIGSLTQLSSLNLRKNQLNGLPPEIGALTQLTQLDLFDNELTALPPEMVALKQLTRLNIHCNRLHKVPLEITALTQLRQLDLANNELTTLLPEIGSLTQLTQLDLFGNQLTALPPEIGSLTQLTQLHLHGNKLTTLPPQIEALTQLTRLSLFCNQLTALPPEIGALTQLTQLNLSYNQLTTLPPEIGALTQLTELDLSRNQLTTLPPEIPSLKQLSFLDIRRNQLTTLPPQIGALTQLRSLQLANNQLMTIPASIGNIQTLTLINLRNNPLILNGENAEQWGRQELRRQFGDRLVVTDPNMQQMPSDTTKEEVYAELDAQQPLRLNREAIANLRLPDINVENVFSVDDMLETLGLIVTSLNLTNQQGAAYLSYEFLANDFASEANQSDYTNEEKVWAYTMPRLTGYIRGLYGVALTPTDVQQWQMYDTQIPETKKVLTYIFEKIRDEADADTKILLFQQLVNGLTHCPTGQAESINAVAYALAEKSYQTNDFVGQLKHYLAVKKNNAFTQAILTKGASSTQNVHLISFYRDYLKEILGLNGIISSFTERLGPCGADPFAHNMWNVVKVFYDLVSPHRILDWAMEICQQTPSATSTTTSSSTSQTQPASSLVNTGMICAYLSDEGLINHDDWWRDYFTADPAKAESALITRNGMMNILIHMGFVVHDQPKK